MKFRAWDVDHRQMLTWEEIMDRTAGSLFTNTASPSDIPGTDCLQGSAPSFIAMCYTGMCDTTGTEVYEGDIIEDAGGRRFCIKYGTYWAVCPVSKCKMDSVGFYAERDGLPRMPLGPLREYAKVVGNVYEESGI